MTTSRIGRGPWSTRRDGGGVRSWLHLLWSVRPGKKDRPTGGTEPPVRNGAWKEVGITGERESTSAALARDRWASPRGNEHETARFPAADADTGMGPWPSCYRQHTYVKKY